MSFNLKSTADLMGIANCGGGLDFDGSRRSTADLMGIATCAKNNGARIVIRGISQRPVAELMGIANCGAGSVMFAD